jgi:hypothetical protein
MIVLVRSSAAMKQEHPGLKFHETPATRSGMARLENVSVEYLRQILAEVDDADATERLMAAITYKVCV